MKDPKSAPKPKSERKRRREEVLNHMEENGPYSVQATVLSKKWGCSRQTISKDINFLISKLDLKEIDKEGKKLLFTIKQNLQLGEKLRLRGKDKDRLKAMEITNRSAELLTRLMEQYGFKEKIADKVEIIDKKASTKEEEIYNKYYGRSRNKRKGNKRKKRKTNV